MLFPIKDELIDGAILFANRIQPPLPQVCLDILHYIFCIIAAPPCNPGSGLPIIICKENCKLSQQIQKSDLCVDITTQLRALATVTTNNDFIVISNAYFNFDCKVPETYFFKNITSSDPDICTNLFPPETSGRHKLAYFESCGNSHYKQGIDSAHCPILS